MRTGGGTELAIPITGCHGECIIGSTKTIMLPQDATGHGRGAKVVASVFSVEIIKLIILKTKDQFI